MKRILQFKTNINCANCVSKVTPFLNKIEGIDNWNVDIENTDKILTVESESVDKQMIIAAIEKVGFDIESI